MPCITIHRITVFNIDNEIGDGKEIINMVHIWKWLYQVNIKAAALAGVADLNKREEYASYIKRAEVELENESFFTQSHLGGAMHDYQSMSIENIMASLSQVNEKLSVVGKLTRHDIRNKITIAKNNFYLLKYH